MSTQDEIIQVRNSLTKNRTEHFGKDVWLEFVRPKFLENIDLTSDMPTRLEGGRGCGKTMLLRYLSFYSQFSTQRENISDDAIKKIGIYWKADTQFLRLMQKRQVEESEWISIFDHYLILSLVVEVLNSVVAVAKSSYPQFFGKDVEAIAFSGIKDYGYRSEDFHEVISETCSRLRKTESFVQNINKENVIEKVPPSFLAFVIDSIKKSKVFALSKFYVYVDEYENLLNYQQRVINTKIKHSEPPLVFNIAIKVNGMSEALTLSDESLENKADYSVVNLDKEIEKSGFSDFVAEILIKKFTIAAPSVLSAIGSAKSHIDFSLTEADRKIIVDKIFPGRSHQDLADEIFETVVYKKKLLSEIEAALNFRSEKVLMANDFVHESFRKASIICSSILYRQSLAVTDIHNELLSLVNGKENRFTNSTAWEHNNFLGCYLRIAKSFKANSSFYSGFDVYVALSGGNVRHFLELCKTAFSFSELDKTLNSIVIGRPIQHLAARSTSEELFAEIQRFTPLGFQLNNFVKGLGKIFQLCQDRFSQSEPEVTHFSIRGDHSNLDSEDIKFIQEAEKWSVLLPTENTKSKSPNFLPFDYVLNPIYAPFFFISYRKGRKIEIEVSDFKSLYSNGIMGISAPLKKRLRISDVEIADDLPSQGRLL